MRLRESMKLLESMKSLVRSVSERFPVKRLFAVHKKKRPGKLKWDIVKILMIAWVIPVVAFTIMIMGITSKGFNAQIQRTIGTSSEKAIEICQGRLENAMYESRKASYISVIEDSISEYRKDNNHIELYNSITQFLNEYYRYDEDFVATIVCPADSPDDIFFTINNSIGSTYDNIKLFNYGVKDIALKTAENLDTGIAFVTVNDRLYMVRNIMDNRFNPVAVIVMELNKESVFGSLESVLGYKDCEIILDGIVIKACDDANRESFDSVSKNAGSDTVVLHQDENAWVFTESVLNNSRFEYAIMLDGDAIFSGKNVIKYMLIIMGVCLIPLMVLVFYSFHRKITKPVRELSFAAKEIASGKYGYKLENFNYSEEFQGLGEAFNRMSEELKHQFEQRYIEELALKDANIRALQSQINPHFLNNTLEIINWEARLSGNDKICGMIEALSTMTEATMNRKKQPMVTLKEELTYVEAYLYIIRQRFGEKFELKSRIDETLYPVMVPRLIIQPIIENAVEHGGDALGYKKVWIYIQRENERLKIVIRNNGKLSGEDIRRVEELLSDDFDEKNDTSTSLGIRNVNRRLKIIYGKEYGLTIKPGKKNDTISILLVKI